MRKANRARTWLVAALCLPAIGAAACYPFGHSAPPPPDKGHQSFVISGNLTGALAPGSPSGPLDLTLRNPNNQALSVASLTVTVTGTSAGTRCAASNFGVTQYQGTYPVQVAARQTKSLTQLGVPAAKLPRVRMIDLPSNQDGCKHVTVYLSYTGTGGGK